jgi:carboxymethylenebutenolidase
LTIHGSLGLTDWYRSQAGAFAEEGFVGLAVDLFSGRLARNLDGEQHLIAEADANIRSTTEALVTWVNWLRNSPCTNGRVGVVGWSFGAWWALRASIAAAPEATVIYYGLKYGNPEHREKETGELRRLTGSLLAHFGEFDTSIPKDQVDRFQGELIAAGSSPQIHWHAADHGFANTALDGYDQAAAAAAWLRTVEFLRANLASPPGYLYGARHVER